MREKEKMQIRPRIIRDGSAVESDSGRGFGISFSILQRFALGFATVTMRRTTFAPLRRPFVRTGARVSLTQIWRDGQIRWIAGPSIGHRVRVYPLQCQMLIFVPRSEKRCFANTCWLDTLARNKWRAFIDGSPLAVSRRRRRYT